MKVYKVEPDNSTQFGFKEMRSVITAYPSTETAGIGETAGLVIHDESDFHEFYDSGRMRSIHFSDYGNGQEHLLPGHGVLPLTRFLNHLRETRYDHGLVLELAPHEFPEETDLIKEALIEIHAYLLKETKTDP